MNRTTRTRANAVGQTWRSGEQEIIMDNIGTIVPPPPIISAPTQMETVPTATQETSEETTDETKKKPWMKEGGKIKKKKTAANKNNVIRRLVQPKNAVMCLNELKSGLSYVTEPNENGNNMPFCVSVEVNGEKFKAYGSTKLLAKQAAAEAALISFVKPPASNKLDSEETPWATIASYALFKLFNEWREGRVGVPYPHNMGAFNPMMTGSNLSLSTSMLGLRTDISKVSENSVRPAKQLPANAATIHPLVVLNQMRPMIKYEKEVVTKNFQNVFVVSAVIDGQLFTGEAPKIKKARSLLAKEAIKSLFNIESTFDLGS